MTTPELKCPNKECQKKMVYDNILSEKKRNIRTFWCIPCSHIVVERRFLVNDVVKSVRRYIFKGELP